MSGTIENIEDHMALFCECGSVTFNLLKSGGVECDDCHKKQDLTWSEHAENNGR